MGESSFVCGYIPASFLKQKEGKEERKGERGRRLEGGTKLKIKGEGEPSNEIAKSTLAVFI